MATFDGSGVLGMLGENPDPQGTPDECRAAGLDLSKVGSCAPRSGKMRGCSQEGICIFSQARYGASAAERAAGATSGFKDKGPRFVGYYKREIDGAQKQDFCTCYSFLQGLRNRMIAGEMARAEGKPHEIIRIIAQEGEEIEINPIIQVDPNDKRQTAQMRRDPHKIKVPRHLRPGENPQATYEQRLWAEEQVRRRYDPDFSGPPAMNQPEDVLDMGATITTSGVVAEPVEKPSKK